MKSQGERVRERKLFAYLKLQWRERNIPYDFSSGFDISSIWLLIFPEANNAMMNIPRIHPISKPTTNIILHLPPKSYVLLN